QYTIQFDRPDSLVKMEKKDRTGYIKHREFIAADPFGPLSGAMMARTMQFQPGDRVVFDIFTGTQRYVLGFHVDGRERITVPAGTFDAFKVTADVVYLSDGDARSKVRETYVWVSADDRPLPLRIAVSAWIGTLHADLVKIEGGKAPAAKVAQN